MANRHLKQRLVSPIFSTIPFSVFDRVTRELLIIPYYHIVSDSEVLHVKNLYKNKTIRQFKEDIDFLLRHYSPVSLREVLSSIKADRPLSKRVFLLTFDDGFREIYDIIAPILLDKGIPATFFISTGFLDNRELCYQHKASLLVEKMREGISSRIEGEIREILMKSGFSTPRLSEGVLKVDYRRKAVLDRISQVLLVDFQNYLNEEQPYLTSDQTKDLIGRGFTIGAHSIDHPHFVTLSLPEQLQQTIVSMKHIRESFGLDYGAFAFPHNDDGVSREFFQTIQKSGLIDITFGTGGITNGGLKSHQQRISLETPLLPARRIIAWQYMRRFYKELRGRENILEVTYGETF